MHYSGITRLPRPLARFIPPPYSDGGKSSHVSFTRIRNVSHKYTCARRAHPPRTRARGARNFFRHPLKRGESPVSPRHESSLGHPRSLSLLPLFPVRSSLKTAIPHLSLHLLDPRRLKRKLVRSCPDGTRTGCPCIFFFSLFFFVTLTAYACHDTGRNKIFWHFHGKVRLKLCTYPYPDAALAEL